MSFAIPRQLAKIWVAVFYRSFDIEKKENFWKVFITGVIREGALSFTTSHY